MNAALDPVLARQSQSLGPALPGERLSFPGGLVCYTTGEGAPLLLVHSVNAAASAAELRPAYEHYATRRTVFALDLPGFGLSERADRDYTPRLMTDALHEAAAQIRQRCGPGPLDAMALSLGCEFLARAACERPRNWGRLALVSPTGFRGAKPLRGAPGATRAIPGLHAVLSVPLWAPFLFDNLTRPKVVRYFLEKTWGGRQIDEQAWAYAVETARAPGARHAPLAFLSGGLFSADILDVYEKLRQPVWMCHGVRGDFTDYRAKKAVEKKPNWRFNVFQTGALPYFERPQEFFAVCDRFLSR